MVEGRPPPTESAGWIRRSRTSIILTADGESINPQAPGRTPIRLTGLVTGNMMEPSLNAFTSLNLAAMRIVMEA